MVNQTCLNIIPIKKSYFESEIWLQMINFVEEFKNMSNLMKIPLRQTTEKNHICPIYLTLACKNLCNQLTTGLLNA